MGYASVFLCARIEKRERKKEKKEEERKGVFGWALSLSFLLLRSDSFSCKSPNK
jgi:hypothetical protein